MEGQSHNLIPDPTVAKTPEEALVWLILQKREDFIMARESYERINRQGAGGSTYEMGARLRSLFEEIADAYAEDFKEDVREDELNTIELWLRSGEEEDILKAWGVIRKWLYKKRVTKFDTRKLQNEPSAVRRSMSMRI